MLNSIPEDFIPKDTLGEITKMREKMVKEAVAGKAGGKLQERRYR